MKRNSGWLVLAFAMAAAWSDEQADTGVLQEKTLEGATLSLVVDQRILSLAQPLHYSLTVEAPPGVDVEFEPVTDHLGDFFVQSRHPLGPINTDRQTRQWQREYFLEAEASGPQVIAALRVTLLPSVLVSQESCRRSFNCNRRSSSDRRGPIGEMTTDPITVDVQSIVPAAAKITEIKTVAPPLAFPAPVRSTRAALPWIAASAVVALAGAGWWWRRRSRSSAGQAMVGDSPDALALQALDRLAAESDGKPAQAEAFYVRLSAILRDYIESHLDRRAKALTTEEFIAELDRNPAALVGHHDRLGGFFSASDRVKFARHIPATEAMPRALDSVREFVLDTAAHALPETRDRQA